MKLRTVASSLSTTKNLFVKQNLLTDNGTGKFSREWFFRKFQNHVFGQGVVFVNSKSISI